MKKLGYCLFARGLSFVLLFGIYHHVPSAQAQQPAAPAPAALVIVGGTLIDGNGGAPVPGSVIVIQGNRITRVATTSQASYPANAQVINAAGKFILPGLFDSQVSYAWYLGEGLINHGITSTIDVGTSGEMAVPYRDAVFHGKFIGPRTFTGISRLAAEYDRTSTGLEGPMTPTQFPKSVQEARDFVRLWVAAGADYIIFDDGGLSMELSRAVFDEAGKANKPVFTRAYGPVMFPKEAALLGSGSLPHSAGIGIAVARDPSKWQARRDDRNELDRYAEMDETKAKELIALLVQHNVALVPTFVINFPGYPKDSARFEAEARQMFTDPDLLAYYPQTAIQSVFARFARGRIDQGEVRERRMRGYQNALRFHKMFVDAGGRLVVSGNTNSTKAPGLDMHHEMQVMAEAGLTPMQIIQGSTKWAAEMLRKQDLLGTIEAGKLADVIILRQNPLQDIRNIGSIETVVFDGKVVDRAYHPNYRVPFTIGSGNSTPTVGALQWVAALKNNNRGGGGQQGQQAAGGGAVPDPANSPQPAIEAINPYIVTQNSGTVTVTLKGINFVRKSAAYFDGRPLLTQVVSSTEIQVTLDTGALPTAGRFDLVVKNPEPIDPYFRDGMWGNGTSNPAHLIVNYKY